MTNINYKDPHAKKAMEAYNQQMFFGEQIKQGINAGFGAGFAPTIQFEGILSKFNGRKLTDEQREFCMAHMEGKITVQELYRILDTKSPNDIREEIGRESIADTRYNTPKESPKAAEQLVEKTVVETEIYRTARLEILRHNMIGHESKAIILGAQRKQIAYGLDKYPEPLNPNTWSIDETIDHIMDESIDKLHYLVMLRIKLEQLLAVCKDTNVVFRRVATRIEAITDMINDTITNMDYLVTMKVVTIERNDSMDAVIYGLRMMNETGLSLGGADMDGDTVLYSKADVEATQRVFEYTSDNQDDLNKKA